MRIHALIQRNSTSVIKANILFNPNILGILQIAQMLETFNMCPGLWVVNGPCIQRVQEDQQPHDGLHTCSRSPSRAHLECMGILALIKWCPRAVVTTYKSDHSVTTSSRGPPVQHRTAAGWWSDGPVNTAGRRDVPATGRYWGCMMVRQIHETFLSSLAAVQATGGLTLVKSRMKKKSLIVRKGLQWNCKNTLIRSASNVYLFFFSDLLCS